VKSSARRPRRRMPAEHKKIESQFGSARGKGEIGGERSAIIEDSMKRGLQSRSLSRRITAVWVGPGEGEGEL